MKKTDNNQSEVQSGGNKPEKYWERLARITGRPDIAQEAGERMQDMSTAESSRFLDNLRADPEFLDRLERLEREKEENVVSLQSMDEFFDWLEGRWKEACGVWKGWLCFWRK